MLRADTRLWIRRALIAACAVALLPAGRQVNVALAAVRRERAAAAAYEQGLMLHLAGRLAEAADAFRGAIALAPSAPLPRRSLAELKARSGHIDAALALYRPLLQLYPHAFDAVLYREVGMIELRGDRLEDARRDLEQALALDPADWQAAYYLGHAYARLGDSRAARTAWRRVATLNPQFRAVHGQLSRLGNPTP